MNLQVGNFQIFEHEVDPSTSSVSGIAPARHLPLLTILQLYRLYHLPTPLPSPGSNSSCLFTGCQPLKPAAFQDAVVVVQLLSCVCLSVILWTVAARLLCPSPSPEVGSNSCSLSQGCHPAISSSVISFSSCPQSSPASGSF